MDHYEEIEREDGLRVPDEYKEMVEAGLFSYFGDKQYEDLTSEQRLEMMRERTLGGKLLYLHYIEWYTPIEGVGMVDGMVPFAGDGSGDQYCWYVPWTDAENGRVPVIYFDHEMWTVKGLAPDYTSWLYRALLEEYTHLDCDLFKPDEIGQLAGAYIEMVRPYLKAVQVQSLKTVTKQSPRQDGDSCSLLSEEECRTMLQEHIKFKYLDVRIEVEPNY